MNGSIFTGKYNACTINTLQREAKFWNKQRYHENTRKSILNAKNIEEEIYLRKGIFRREFYEGETDSTENNHEGEVH